MLILFFIVFTIISGIYFAIIVLIDAGIFRLKSFVKPETFPSTRVSIIIPARNEESNITDSLCDLECQDYPKHLMEIVVVDDHSTDSTEERVNAFAQSHPLLNIRLIPISKAGNDRAFKKHSIRTGVKATSGEIIITTDADTRLLPGWISSIVGLYESLHPEMIIAPVAFFEENTLFEKIQSLEFAGLMAATAGSCKMGFPLMCNGANLAFTRKGYEATLDSGDDLRYPSGDDLFLMMKIRKKYGSGAISYLWSEEAIVRTKAKKTLHEFFSQRLRWVSKSKGYTDPVVKTVAIMTWLFNFLLLAALIGGIFNLKLLLFSIFIFGWKMILELPAVWRILALYHKKKTLILYPLTQILNIAYVILIGVLGNVITYEWKGRKVSPLKSNTPG
jgi:cellulose synthase/poly-beta-1,6-N-acetylglucosamine synthase-like glycosyltransferase